MVGLAERFGDHDAALLDAAERGGAEGLGDFFRHEPLAGPVAKSAGGLHGMVEGF